MDLSDLIERNAAFTPDKPAIIFEGETLELRRARCAYRADRARAEGRMRRRPRRPRRDPQPEPAGLSGAALCLRAARRHAGAAELAAGGGRATVHPVGRLGKGAGARAGLCGSAARAGKSLPDTSIVGLDFSPARGIAFDALLTQARGDGRNPHTDLSCPLLIVYTSGTTGRPKGAVLRQEALLWNGVMSQHMHGLTSDDHVLTVLPFFHVGGLNIQTTPALHHGATVTIHSRFTPDATLAAIARDRPTLDGAGAGDHPGGDRPSRLGVDRPVLAEGDLDRIDHRAAASDRPLYRARGAGASGLWLDRNLPDRGLYPARRRSLARRLDRPARPVLRGGDSRRRRQRTAAGNARRDRGARPQRVLRILGQRGSDARGAARRLVSHRRHRPARRRRLFLGARPQEEPDHFRRREHLSGGSRARAAGASRCQRNAA